MSDEETRQFIRDAFAVARENDVAVALHIDDSMSWGQRKDLLSNPDNIETADWKQIPNTGRRLIGGPSPPSFRPRCVSTAPAIVAAVKDRAGLIGAEIKRELAALEVRRGRSTCSRPSSPDGRPRSAAILKRTVRWDYRALSHRGFSEKQSAQGPGPRTGERRQGVDGTVGQFSSRGGNSPREDLLPHRLHDPGTAQGGRQGIVRGKSRISPCPRWPSVPPTVRDFPPIPREATFKEIYAALAAHGSPGWISAEGTNVSPTSMPGEPTMETYLGRMFNHGAVMVNVFSWGIGGEAMRNNFFRRATENPEALAAYAKFLRRRDTGGIRRPGIFQRRRFKTRCTGFKRSFRAGFKNRDSRRRRCPWSKNSKRSSRTGNGRKRTRWPMKLLSLMAHTEK